MESRLFAVRSDSDDGRWVVCSQVYFVSALAAVAIFRPARCSWPVYAQAHVPAYVERVMLCERAYRVHRYAGEILVYY